MWENFTDQLDVHEPSGANGLKKGIVRAPTMISPFSSHDVSLASPSFASNFHILTSPAKPTLAAMLPSAAAQM
jgi:hypothetical protein